MKGDRDDMVAVVTHLTRIVKRRAGQPISVSLAVAPELVSSLCLALGLDDQEIAHEAMSHVAAMERPQ